MASLAVTLGSKFSHNPRILLIIQWHLFPPPSFRGWSSGLPHLLKDVDTDIPRHALIIGDRPLVGKLTLSFRFAGGDTSTPHADNHGILAFFSPLHHGDNDDPDEVENE